MKRFEPEILTAELPSGVDRKCTVFGCPESGTISPSNVGPAAEAQWFCRFHFGETADRWPEITRQRRLFWDNHRPQKDEPVEVTPRYIATVREELGRFAKSFGKPSDPKGWAKKLKVREEAGDYLGDAQQSAWRETLRFRAE